MIDWLGDALRCPKTGAALVREGDSYVSTGTPVYRYPIEGGVPILLPHAAQEVSEPNTAE